MATYPGGIPSLTRPVAGDPANDGSATDATVVIDALSDELEAVAGELGVNPSGGSATVVARLDALDTTVSGKAASSHTHTAANVTDFAETVRDTIGSALVAGTNVTITVNDGADTITIDAAGGGGGGLSEEEVEDVVAGLLVAGSNISLTYDDVANTLTVAVTGLGTAAALSTADIDERARDAVGTALTAGTGITVTPNDGADTITVATSAVLPTVVDAKGDLLVGTAADTVGRLAVGTNGHVLTADSAEASGVKWAAASGGASAGIVSLHTTGTPTGGSDNDWSLLTSAISAGSTQPLLDGNLYRKASGSWSTSLNADGSHAHVIQRTVSQTQGVPAGWSLTFPDGGTWLSSAPADITCGGLTYTSGYHATAAGTRGYMTWTRGSLQSSAGLAFFSMVLKIDALPEATRYLWAGQYGYLGGLYGYGVRVDSSGNFEIGAWQEFLGDYTSTVTGGTGLVAGDRLLIERFGHRMTAYRVSASGYGMALGSSVSALLRGFSYADSTGKTSFGFATDANSVRVTGVKVIG